MHLIKNKEKRKRIAHIVAGLTILVHAYENYETHHHSWQLFAVAGLIFLTLAILHPVIEKKWPWIDGVFFVIEGILSITVSIDLFMLGKKALPFVYILLGIFQFYIAFRKGRKGQQEHHKRHKALTDQP